MPPQDYQQPPTATPPAPLFTSEPPQPRSRLWRKVAIIVGIVLLVNVIFSVGLWLYNKPASLPKTNDAVLTTLDKPTLTEANVRDVPKDEAFYAYLKFAAQQSKQTITKAFYYSDDGRAKPEDTFVRTAIDYQTKKIVYAYDRDDGLTGRDHLRCYDGQVRFYNGIIKEWIVEDSSDSLCAKDRLYASATDGFNAGGLTAEQAELFVGYLRAQPGLVAVKDLELTTHAGKQYLHFQVALNQIKTKSTYFGAQWLMFAFQKTGLDPFEYPYGYVGAGGQGFELDYYVDPTTRLPAYSELASIPRQDDAGKSDPSSYHYRVQYDFTKSTFDASPANNSNIAITW